MIAVRYTPPFMDQIRNRRANRADEVVPEGRIVIVKTPSGYVPHVDARTREAMAVPQQFVTVDNSGTLRILPPWAWITQPDVVEVGELRLS